MVQNTPYPVVGVLLNPAVKAARVAKTDPAYTDWSILDFETGSDIIGHDWKYFDMNSFQYIVEDSLMYFAKAQQSGVIKLVFGSFAGSSTGIATFTTELISLMGIGEASADVSSIYPNPASGQLNLILPGNTLSGKTSLFDLSGRLLREWVLSGTGSMTLDVSGLNPGTYFLKTNNNGIISGNKVVLVK